MFKYIEEIDLVLPPIVVQKITEEIQEKNSPAKDTVFGNLYTAAKNNTYIENKFLNEEAFKIFSEHTETMIAKLTPYSFSPKLNNAFLRLIPKELLRHNPQVNFQTIENYKNYAPHRDFVRLSSLFYLIRSNGSTTKWWEPVEEYKNYFTGEYKFVPPGYEQVQLVKECTLEEGKWYVFDHESFHSVHTDDRNGCRIALLISFKDLPAEKLYDIMIEEGYS
jgi:hypothetical protein